MLPSHLSNDLRSRCICFISTCNSVQSTLRADSMFSQPDIDGATIVSSFFYMVNILSELWVNIYLCFFFCFCFCFGILLLPVAFIIITWLSNSPAADVSSQWAPFVWKSFFSSFLCFTCYCWSIAVYNQRAQRRPCSDLTAHDLRCVPRVWQMWYVCAISLPSWSPSTAPIALFHYIVLVVYVASAVRTAPTAAAPRSDGARLALRASCLTGVCNLLALLAPVHYPFLFSLLHCIVLVVWAGG